MYTAGPVTDFPSPSPTIQTTSFCFPQDHFKQVGHVQFVEIPEDAQGRSQGRATVRFASDQDAANAINQLNNTELDGRQLYVREYTNN